MQMEAGAAGITCAKVSEAEVMADGGLKDIFIAYPMVGDFRIRRAIALKNRVDRLILAVDSLEGAQRLNDAAIAADVRLEVRLEVDTGAKRTGAPRMKAASLAREIAGMKNLDLTGIYTFKSLLYKDRPTDQNELAGREEGEMMRDIANTIREAGVTIRDISAGSTPTGLAVAQTGLVTEIRPGTYIFKDVMLTRENVGTLDEIAVRFFATVVSTPNEEYAVIDGGTKTFPTHVPILTPPMNYPGYAMAQGRPDLRLTRMNEEHGMLISTQGKTGLSVGQKIALLPIHVCTAVNMQNQVYLMEKGALRVQKVDARGMLV
jgi:D-serine deaminase-like pyridoxal phosphate-dependent protein